MATTPSDHHIPKSLTSNKVYKIPKCGDELEFEYPSKWFTLGTNIAKKPSVSIEVHSSLLIACQDMSARIAKDMITKDAALILLYLFINEDSQKCEEEWKSYDRVIATANENINPWKIISVTTTAMSESDLIETAEGINKKDANWMAMLVVGIYRVANTPHKEHKSRIINLIANFIKNLGCAKDFVTTLGSLALSCEYWINDLDVRKMMAAIDMFYYRFKNAPNSIYRAGTIICRYRDCAALTSVNHLGQLYGFEPRVRIMYWVFSQTLERDFERLYSTSDEELTLPYSYFPYHMDLGLANRSAYSTTANPAVYAWTAIAGCFRHDERSRNARYLLTTDVPSIVANAAFLGYVFNKNRELKRMVVPSNEQQGSSNEENKTSEDSSVMDYSPETDPSLNTVVIGADGQEIEEPNGTNGNDWVKYLERTNFKYTPPMVEYFKEFTTTMLTTRKGTIGEFVKTHFSNVQV